MSQPSQFAAQLLESSASAYAAYAANLLLENHPAVGERFAPNAMRDWQASLTQRVLELSAALAAEDPRLFVSRTLWEGKAFRARGLATED